MRIFVSNLTTDLKDFELRSLFASSGKIVSAKVIVDKDSGMSTGSGYVDFESSNEAQRAASDYNGYQLNRNVLIVSHQYTGGHNGSKL